MKVGKLLKKYQTLIGSIMIYFSFGSIVSFGSTFIYIVSYFREFDKTISIKSSVATSAIAIPAGICALLSIKIASFFGLKRVIFCFLLIFSGLIFMSSFMTNLKIFLLTYFIIPSVVAFGLIYMPLLNNVWNVYKKNKGAVTGFMFGTLGISQIFFIFLTTMIVNPMNKKAILKIKEDKNLINYFDQEVTVKVPLMIQVQSLMILLFSFSGLFFITETQEQNEQKEVSFHQFDYELSNEISTEIENRDRENVGFYKKTVIRSEEIDKITGKTRECPSLKAGIYSQPFILIFLISFFISIYGLFLGMNLRGYCLTKVNDDHFVTIVIFLNGFGASAGKIFWGFIFDKTTFKKLFVFLIAFYFFVSIPLMYLAENKYFLLIFIVLISFSQGGIISTVGPGILEIFGKKVGPVLFQMKVLSFYSSIFLTPLVSYWLLHFLTMDQILKIYSSLNGISIILAYMIDYDHEWKLDL